MKKWKVKRVKGNHRALEDHLNSAGPIDYGVSYIFFSGSVEQPEHTIVYSLFDAEYRASKRKRMRLANRGNHA